MPDHFFSFFSGNHGHGSGTNFSVYLKNILTDFASVRCKKLLKLDTIIQYKYKYVTSLCVHIIIHTQKNDFYKAVNRGGKEWLKNLVHLKVL